MLERSKDSQLEIAMVGKGSVEIIKSHGQVTLLLFPIFYLMEVVNLANGSITS